MNVLALKKYCAITFPNTHSALAAEKALKAAAFPGFVIMPVPKLISAGCGLAIKTSQEAYGEAVAVLNSVGVAIGGVFSIDNDAGNAVSIM